MTPRRLAVLAGISGAVALVACGLLALVDLGPPDDALDDDAGGTSVATKGSLPRAPAAIVPDGRVAPGDAALVDVSLLSPYPALAPGDPSLKLAAMGRVDPVMRFTDDIVGAIGPSAALLALRKAIVVPRLDRDEILTVAHITQIKAGLNLSPEQERHWAPLEAEFRQLIRQFAAQRENGKKPMITASEAQRLYWAAGPLIMSMSQDQKQEIRRIARKMGLEQLAALI